MKDKALVGPIVSVLLSVYGAIHCGLSVLIFGLKGSLGIGSVLSLGAFVALGVFSIREFSRNTGVDRASEA